MCCLAVTRVQRLVLDELSLTLIADRDRTKHASVEAELAQLTLSGFQLRLDARVAGLRAEGSLAALQMLDCQAAPGSLGHAFLRTTVAASDIPGSAAAEPQWFFRIVQRPPDRTEDVDVSISINSPLEVVHNPQLLRRIHRFFAIAQETERAELAALVGSALDGAQRALRELTSDALKAVLARRTTTAVSLQLAAPRIILPEDLSDPRSSVLVVSMGAISLSSVAGDSAAVPMADAHGSPATPAVDVSEAAHGSASNRGDATHAALFDRYALELSSMQVLVAPADVDWRSQVEQLRRKLHVVYQFGLQLELRTCILPPGSHAFDQFIVSGALSDKGSPSINVRLSTNQLRTVSGIIRKVLGDLSADAPLTEAVAVPEALVSASTMGTPRSPMTLAGGSPPQAAAPEAGVPTKLRAELALQNFMLMISDEVDGAERELAVFRTSNIALQVKQWEQGYRAKFSIQSVTLDDRTPGATAQRLMDSDPEDGRDRSIAEPVGDLVRVDYVSSPQRADELHLRFSRLHLEWNPETIAAVLAFFRVASASKPRPVGRGMDGVVDALSESTMLGESVYLDALPDAGSSSMLQSADSIKGVPADGIDAMSDAGRSSSSLGLKVIAQLESLSVSLNAERSGERLALLTMQDLGANVIMPAGGGMTIVGQLGNLTAQDTLLCDSAPYEMLGLRASGSSLLTFEYDSPPDEKRAAARNSGAYDSSLKLRMSSVQVSYWHSAVMRMWHYLQSGVLGALVSATASTVAHMARSVLDPEVSAMSLDIEIGSPLVLLATQPGGSDGLRADLGRMGVRNTLVRRTETEGRTFGSMGTEHEAMLDVIRVTVEKMRVDSVESEGVSMAMAFEKLGEQMLRDAAFEILVERGVGRSMHRPLTIIGHGGELACNCSKAQYELLMSCLRCNLANRTPEPLALHHAESGGPTQVDRDSSAVSQDDPQAERIVTFHLPLLSVQLTDVAVLGGSRALLSAQLRGMRVRYSSGSQMQVHLSLESLRVLDEMRAGSLLLDSLPEGASSDTDLAQLADLSYCNGGQHQLDELHLRFSRLHLEWNPETIAAVLAFFRVASASKPRPVGRGMDGVVDALSESTMLGESVYLDALPDAGSSSMLQSADSIKGVPADGIDAMSDAGRSSSSLGLKVIAQLESLSVSLNAERSGERLALLTMQDLGANVIMPAGGGMTIVGQLGNLTAQDTLLCDSAPYEMLGLRASGSSLLTFEYDSPPDEKRAAARNSGAYDSSLKLRMSSVQVSYWHSAVMRMWHYLQSGVLGALVSATASTVAHMARSVLDPEVSAMSLDIEIGSPLVLLATQPGGSDGLRADLGRMGVRNTLVRRTETEGRTFGSMGTEHEAMLDVIRVTVEKMRVDSVESEGVSMAMAFEKLGEQMLRDAAFEILVERGVGRSMHRPLTIIGHGGELACNCSKAQYELLLHVLTSNFVSRGPSEPAAAPASTPPSHHRSGQADASIETRLLAKFDLGAATLRLSNASGPLVSTGLRAFSVEVKHQTNSDLEVTVSCGSVEVLNEREQGPKWLLWGHHAARAAASPPPQLHMVYSTEDCGSARLLVINLHGTKMNFAYGVFLSAASFFGSVPEKDINHPKSSGTVDSAHSIAPAVGDPPTTPVPTTSRVAAPASSKWEGFVQASPPATQRGRVVLLLSFQEAEVVLPRQQGLQDSASGGISICGAFVVKYRRERGGEQVDVEVMQLSMNRLVGPNGNGALRAVILAPADVSFKMSRGVSHSGGLKTEVSLQASQLIECFLSYNDAKLITEIAKELHDASNHQDDATVRETANAVVCGKPDEPTLSISLPSVGPSAMHDHSLAGDSAPRSSATSEVQLSGAVQVDGIRLVLLNDFNGRSVPLLSSMFTPLGLAGSGTPSHFMVESEVGAAIDLYNAAVCAWEPMVEACSFQATASFERGTASPKTSLRLDAPKPCNVNFSSPMCELLSQTILTLADDVTGAVALRHNDADEDDGFVPFAITNHTGVPLRYGRAHAGPPEALLVPAATETFNFWPEALERRVLCERGQKPSSSITAICEGWSPVEEIPIDYVGRRVYQIYPSQPTALADGDNAQSLNVPCDVILQQLGARADLNGRRGRAISLDAESGRYHVVLYDGGETVALRMKSMRPIAQPPRAQRIICEVTIVDDQKRVELSSTTRVHNVSNTPLDVRISHTGSDIDSVHPLAPEGILPLPLLIDGGSYSVCLRPASGEHEWCEKMHVPAANSDARPATTVALECQPAVGGASTWHSLLQTSTGHQNGVWELAVQPTMELRNLLAGPLRLELVGSGVSVGRTLASGESLRTHAFAQGTAVSLAMQVAGYRPSDRQLVAAPPGFDEDVLCRTFPLLDAHENALEVRISYDTGASSVHTLSLHAPYWVANNTGLPISIRELGAAKGFSGDEATVVRELVCENQRRPTVLHDFSAGGLFSTDSHGPFSDEGMLRRYINLGGVWLPPGWVWLDDAWDMDRTSSETDAAGWEYASNWTSGWAPSCTVLSLVRRRRWVRHRALAAKMDARTAGRLSDDAIMRMTAAELRTTIASGGLAHRDCTTREALRARAHEARDSARQVTPRISEAPAGRPTPNTTGSPASAATGGSSAAPIMPPVLAGSRLQIQLPGSAWSAPILIEAAGTHGLLEVDALPNAPSASQPRAYQLGLSIASCPGVFGRSKMLTVSPRVLLCNTLPRHAVAYKQHEVNTLGEVLFSGDSSPFHWRQPTARLLSVSLLPETIDRADDLTACLSRCDWSCAFPISDVGDFTIVCKPPDPGARRQKLFLNVDVQATGAETSVIFSLQDASLAPYRIDNLTGRSLLISQSPCAELEHPRVIDEVPPRGRVPFAWEHIVDRPTLDVHIMNMRVPIFLDDLHLEGVITLPPADAPERVRYRMATDGPVKVLQLVPVDASLASEASRSRGPARESPATHSSLAVSFASIGVSLIDSTPRELLYFSISDVAFSAAADDSRGTVTLSVRSLQIDNQLPSAVFPVLLRPGWTDDESACQPPPPAVEMRLQLDLANPGLRFFESVSLRVQTIQLMVDTLLVRTLLLYVYEVHADLIQVLSRLLSALQLERGSAPKRADKVYMHWLNIQPLRVLVSCRSVAGGVGLETFLQGAPEGAVGILNSVGALLSNVDRAPIKLKALVLENAFAPADVLLASIGSSYKEQVLSQLYKVLLSFEVLGNPRGFFKKMGAGVHDFFHEPLTGLLTSSDEFRAGVLRGRRSFHDNVVLSVGDSMHKFSGAVAKGLAEITMDKDFLEERHQKSAAAIASGKATQSRSVGEGLIRGADTIAGGFRRGVTTLVSEPVKGAQAKGVEGFFKGLGKGAVSALVKPLVGAADAVSDGLMHTAADLKAGQGVFAQRTRLPRALGASGEVLPFSQADAEAQQQLSVICQAGGKRFRSLGEGRYCGARPSGEGQKRVIVTTSHVVSIHVGLAARASGSSNSGGSGIGKDKEPKLEWYEQLANVRTLEESGKSLVLHLQDGGMRFLPCSSTELRACFHLVEQALRTLHYTDASKTS